jgi:hypothetical protein
MKFVAILSLLALATTAAACHWHHHRHHRHYRHYGENTTPERADYARVEQMPIVDRNS